MWVSFYFIQSVFGLDFSVRFVLIPNILDCVLAFFQIEDKTKDLSITIHHFFSKDAINRRLWLVK
jgi:hypothetical protein